MTNRRVVPCASSSRSAQSESDTQNALLSLLEKDLIRLGPMAKSPTRSERATKPETLPSRPSVDDAVVAELDRLLALGRNRDFAALLGVSATAAESERKSSYLKLVGKYHPDRYPRALSITRSTGTRFSSFDKPSPPTNKLRSITPFTDEHSYKTRSGTGRPPMPSSKPPSSTRTTSTISVR